MYLISASHGHGGIRYAVADAAAALSKLAELEGCGFAVTARDETWQECSEADLIAGGGAEVARPAGPEKAS